MKTVVRWFITVFLYTCIGVIVGSVEPEVLWGLFAFMGLLAVIRVYFWCTDGV